MDADRRESLRRSLRVLAESYAATLRLMEETYTLLADELSLAPLHYFAGHTATTGQPTSEGRPVLDDARLTVTFRGRTCYLGSTLSFRLLVRLSHYPNCYVTHEDLLDDVWGGAVRSEGVIRSAIKVLRQKLRRADMGELADAIDGSAPGRYALRLAR